MKYFKSRAQVFRMLLDWLEKHSFRLYARFQLQILASATARGFGKKGYFLLIKRDPLKAYAEFTQHAMLSAVSSGQQQGEAGLSNQRMQVKLYQNAERLGAMLRRVTGFTDPADQARLIFYLYRNIGIMMMGSLPGEIKVSECYFSQFYSPSQCAWISAMDHGIIAGICGDGELNFTGRITEGCGQCTACFRKEVSHE